MNGDTSKQSKYETLFDTAKPQDVGLSSTRLNRISQTMQRHIDEQAIPGLLAMVVRRGKIGYLECFGMADVEAKRPIQPDTLFRLQSMTKPVTSVAIMMLYEEGRFHLNDSVSKYLSEFKDIQVGIDVPNIDVSNAESGQVEMQLVAPEREVTIHHLLTHMSGLVYPNSEGSTAEKMVGTIMKSAEVVRDADGNKLSSRPPDETHSKWIQRLVNLPLAHHPGTTWHYGFSTDVLAYLVEVISGDTFDEFLRQRVFEPLGMSDTGFHVPPEKIHRLATMYGPVHNGSFQVVDGGKTSAWATPKKFLSGGGGPGWGLVSTTTDYARFAQMLLNGGEFDQERLLSRKSIELMTLNHLPTGIHPRDKQEVGFGLGFWIMLDVARSQRLNSVGSYGWDGGAGTRFWVDPKEEMIGLVMAQCLGVPWVVQEQFPVLTYQAIDD